MVGKTQKETEEFYSVYIYGNETVRLIKRHAALYASSPLYVYLAWNVVHAPDEAPAWAVADNPGESNKQRQLFAGMLSALDVGVRHVIDELKAQSMWDTTIFVFSVSLSTSRPLPTWLAQLSCAFAQMLSASCADCSKNVARVVRRTTAATWAAAATTCLCAAGSTPSGRAARARSVLYTLRCLGRTRRRNGTA